MIADLRSALPTKTAPVDMDRNEYMELLGEMATASSQAVETFRQIEQKLISLNNILALAPFAGQADVVVRDATGEEWFMTVSKEALIEIKNPLQGALISIKNFFLNLWGQIKAFFKRMFDSNLRNRTKLSKYIRAFTKNRDPKTDALVNNTTIYLPRKDDVITLIQNLNILFADTDALSNVPSIKEAAKYYAGLNKFGYTVNEGVVSEQNRLVLNPIKSKFSDEWSISEFIEATNQVCTILVRMAALTNVQRSLENDVNKSIREIDKFLALGETDKAMPLQYALNDKSLKSAYVFKCTTVLQSYVTQITIMFCDIWENISDY